IPEKYLDLLQRKKAFANLATLMPDGSPQVTPVWCDYKDGLVRVNTAKGRVKARNLKKDAPVALAIADPDNPYRYVQIRGRVRRVTEDGAAAHIDSLAKKYLGKDKYPSAAPGEVRLMCEIEPTSASGMGGTAGGYSGLTFPSTIPFFHFSYSERVKAAACSGVVPRGVMPILAKADFSSGCCSTLLISPLSFVSTAGGSLAGA